MIHIEGIRHEDAQTILANVHKADPAAMYYEGRRMVNGSVLHATAKHNPEYGKDKIASYAWTWDVEIKSTYYTDSTLEDFVPDNLKEFIVVHV